MSPATQIAILFALLRLTRTYARESFCTHNGKALSELWDVALTLFHGLPASEKLDVQDRFNLLTSANDGGHQLLDTTRH